MEGAADQPKWRVLVVDDDASLLGLVGLILRLEGLEVVTAATGNDARHAWQEHWPNLMVLDLRLGDGEWDGRSLYSAARAAGYGGPVIIMSAFGAERARAEVGADAAVAKPFAPEHLVEVVRELLPSRDAAAT